MQDLTRSNPELFEPETLLDTLKQQESDDTVVVSANGKTEYTAQQRREAELMLMAHLGNLQARRQQEEEQKVAAVQKLLARRPPRDHLQRERSAIEKRLRRNAKRAALVKQGKLK